jgi:N-acetyl-beta-hexosaminidase
MEDVLDYVCRLFPGDVVHIGGDECPQVRWKDCPKCQARIKAEGLKDEHGLQPWITRHFVKFLEARGKRALGWDEYLLGDVPKSAIGMSWRTRPKSGAGHALVSGAQAAVRGHDVVMTPNKFCYLDYGQCLPNDPIQYIGGKLPLETCYSFDPCADVPEFFLAACRQNEVIAQFSQVSCNFHSDPGARAGDKCIHNYLLSSDHAGARQCAGIVNEKFAFQSLSYMDFEIDDFSLISGDVFYGYLKYIILYFRIIIIRTAA